LGEAPACYQIRERAFKKRNAESTRAPQEILVTHSLSTKPGWFNAKHYGRIVVTGVGEADTIGDTSGDGVPIGCAWAINVPVPASDIPARTSPINQRFIPFSSG
jgi:hypothetical protein